jgi:hypothetical protein
MAILAGLAGMLGRFAGRLLNTTLGWATTLLFGRVAQRNQSILLIVVFAALGWVALVAGVLLPDVGTMLIAFVPVPDFVDEAWIRLAMLAGALALPLLVGAAVVFVTPADQRPGGAALVKAILRGYPFTLALALTIVVLAGVATFRRLRALAKRWEDTHVAVIVKPGRYDDVLGRIHAALDTAGVATALRPAPRIVSLPPKVLDAAAGHGLGALVPDRLMLLAAPDLEILVYPSDLAISGSKSKVAAARAAIVSRLTYAPAWMTVTAEAQQVEDEIVRLADVARAGRLGDVDGTVATLDERLAQLVVPYEEWESVYRQRLQLERDLRRAGHDAAEPDEEPESQPSPMSRRLTRGVAAALIALVVTDIALLLGRRRDGDSTR